jgi:predicted nucleic acid-binding protein
MRFWDTSAILPLLVTERSTHRLQSLIAGDPIMIVWWASEVECVAALSRLERDGALNAQGITLARKRLGQLTAAWHEIDQSEAIREAAIRFLRVHPLRAADALQLAAAFVAAERRPTTLEVLTLDDRLSAAAQKEGFALIPIDAE